MDVNPAGSRRRWAGWFRTRLDSFLGAMGWCPPLCRRWWAALPTAVMPTEFSPAPSWIMSPLLPLLFTQGSVLCTVGFLKLRFQSCKLSLYVNSLLHTPSCLANFPFLVTGILTDTSLNKSGYWKEPKGVLTGQGVKSHLWVWGIIALRKWITVPGPSVRPLCPSTALQKDLCEFSLMLMLPPSHETIFGILGSLLENYL